MLFSSITFIYFFLPAVMLVYFVVPANYRNGVLLLFSLFFYFVGEPKYTILLIFSAVSNYLYSIYIEKHRGEVNAKIMLILSLVINIGILAFFKYADFFIADISLPVGISFFTFQTMSYTIDVYTGDVKAEKSIINLSAYVCLFPQLIAGPIVRYSEIAKELKQRKSTIEGVSHGIVRFVIGLGKKVLIANTIGQLCSIYIASDENTVIFTWMYAIAFTLQLYFDFSGYSDMAIGLGKIFGFTFPENFNYPYTANSITDFWRRWHMTLTKWFRDYVYIPLGGNRTTDGKWIRNVFLVWMLTGIWHGAYWNFILWGVSYGIIMIIEKKFLLKYLDKWPKALRHCYVLLIVVLGFVIFNGQSVEQIFTQIKSMFGFGGISLSSELTWYYLKSYVVLFIVGIIGATPLCKKVVEKYKETAVMTIAQPIFVGVVLICITAFLVDGSFNPFLYFRF